MNILRLIGQRGLLGPDAPVRHAAKRRRLKTVMQELIYRAGRLIRSKRKLVLGLGANDRSGIGLHAAALRVVRRHGLARHLSARRQAHGSQFRRAQRRLRRARRCKIRSAGRISAPLSSRIHCDLPGFWVVSALAEHIQRITSPQIVGGGLAVTDSGKRLGGEVYKQMALRREWQASQARSA